jgi:hypothetical protein
MRRLTLYLMRKYTSYSLVCAMAVLMSCRLVAEPIVGNPVGYIVWSIPAKSTRLMGLHLVSEAVQRGVVTEVGADYVRATGWAGDGPLGDSASAIVRFITGAYSGLTIPLTHITGNTVGLVRSPIGMVQLGDEFYVYPNWTMEQLFGEDNRRGLLEGDSMETADTVSLWDQTEQKSHIYYFKSGEGFREAGNEDAGDQLGVVVPALSGLVITNRGNSELSIYIVGAVPMPLEKSYLWVEPGRNLISTPLNNAGTLNNLFLSDPPALHTFVSGPAAPKADTLKMSFASGAEASILYFKKRKGWWAVGGRGHGGPANAGDTPVEFSTGIDYNRVGPAGYLGLRGVIADPSPALVAASSLLTAPLETVPVRKLSASKEGIRIEWKHVEESARYQVQSRDYAGGGWTNLGEPVTPATEVGSLTCRPEGSGELRVLIL